MTTCCRSQHISKILPLCLTCRRSCQPFRRFLCIAHKQTLGFACIHWHKSNKSRSFASQSAVTSLWLINSHSYTTRTILASLHLRSQQLSSNNTNKHVHKVFHLSLNLSIHLVYFGIRISNTYTYPSPLLSHPVFLMKKTPFLTNLLNDSHLYHLNSKHAVPFQISLPVKKSYF